MARRWQALQAEIDELDTHLAALVTTVAPQLVALPGVGVDTAGQVLVTAGVNPHRLRSEAAFARLRGVALLPAARPLAALGLLTALLATIVGYERLTWEPAAAAR